MIRVFRYNEIDRSEIFSRDIMGTKNVEGIVTDIIKNVIERKDDALFEYCEKFDKASLESLEVSKEEIDEAFSSVEPEFIDILKKAAENIYAFHSRHHRPHPPRPRPSWRNQKAPLNLQVKSVQTYTPLPMSESHGVVSLPFQPLSDSPKRRDPVYATPPREAQSACSRYQDICAEHLHGFVNPLTAQ